MVVAACRRAADAVAWDVRAFAHRVRSLLGRSLAPGLHTYRLTTNDGRRRLHLRAHPDGTGALFVDVSHVVHLTPTAVEIARLLLDGLPPRHVTRLVHASYPAADPAQVEADVEHVRSALDSMGEPGAQCPTCVPALERAPLFSHRARAPYKADLALTYACNNNCAHCYNEPDRRKLAPLDAHAWRTVLRRLAGIGVPHVIFTGGEPTLVDELPELVRHADRLGQVTGVNTNGRRLADERITRALADAGLEHIQITVASHIPEVHDATVRAGAHREMVRGIRNALAAGIHTITNTTLTHRNAGHAIDTIEFVHALGVRTFAMNGMICSGRGRSNAEALSEGELTRVLAGVRDRAAELEMRFLWYTPTEYCRLSPVELGLGAKACNAAEYSICIEPNGDVLPCQSYYEPVGNLLDDDWTAIWDSPLFHRIRMRREDPRRGGLPERCYDCPDLQVCGGGCPLQRAERPEEAVLHGR